MEITSQTNGHTLAQSVPQAEPTYYTASTQTVSIYEYNKVYTELAFWRSAHKKSVLRCAKHNEEIAQIKASYKEKLKKVRLEYESEIATLEEKLKKREQQLFGKTSEKNKKSEVSNGQSSSEGKKRPRGQQKGSQGHGRRDYNHLRTQEEMIDLPACEKSCSTCGRAHKLINSTEDSESIEIIIKAHRRIIRRKKYKKDHYCQCANQPPIITAPKPAKLIEKSNIGTSVWTHLLVSKYAYYIPLYRTLNTLALHGAPFAQGTITGGFKRILKLIRPLHVLICEMNRKQVHHHADETRWEVFEPIENKQGHRWYLWIFRATNSVVYNIDPTRSSHVPKKHFKAKNEGIISVDRFSAYKKYIKDTLILLAYCWAHVRRDFLDYARSHPDTKLEAWSMKWVDRISKLYHLNNARLALEVDSARYKKTNLRLKNAVLSFEQTCKKQLNASHKRLADGQKKILTSLLDHWQGLIIFVVHPDIPMDNNRAENGLRGPVVLRKTAYGSGSLWSAELTAMLFSLFGTLRLWGINEYTWLYDYLNACADNAGQVPADIDTYLPWKMDEERLHSFSQPIDWNDTS